jgi:hypothetical protein
VDFSIKPFQSQNIELIFFLLLELLSAPMFGFPLYFWIFLEGPPFLKLDKRPDT